VEPNHSIANFFPPSPLNYGAILLLYSFLHYLHYLQNIQNRTKLTDQKFNLQNRTSTYRTELQLTEQNLYLYNRTSTY